jgi:[protein-PII] uridylyltransferase
MATPVETPAAAPPRTTEPNLAAWRNTLRSARDELREAFFASPDTARLLRDHASLVDRVIRGVWSECAMPDNVAAMAVGGYGRGQLYPHSDVDVLILLATGVTPPAAAIERFFAALWDIGVELSHAVRSVEECEVEMVADVTVRTSLLENRLLAGSRALHRQFRRRFAELLDIRAFYDAKALEQQQRHLKYQDAIYNLEPNVKESPGGTARSFVGAVDRARGRIRQHLARARAQGPHDLGRSPCGRAPGAPDRRLAHPPPLSPRPPRGPPRVRRAEHARARPRTDRHAGEARERAAHAALLPRRQARAPGEHHPPAEPARELYPAATGPVAIDEDFQQVDEHLDVRDETLFARRPSAMLDAFLALQRHRELKGMTARTLRALWQERHRIDAVFRHDHGNRARFIAMFRAERGLLHGLRRMNLYGVLGQYLPVFGRIVGQMQHDLFHVYTVDEHILMVIRNLRRFTEAQHAHEYPLCSRLIADFERREVLYVAGLFHDIAKGRGGDHSTLGARDARRFCREHGLSDEDAELVAWLVGQHLTMSSTAQKQDLSDPEVIAAFARKVGTERRLTALYLLTVADIRGTSPKVWNNWKGKLLEDLYHVTRSYLGGATAMRTIMDSIDARRVEAQRLLRLYAVPDGAESALWKHLDTPYFQRHSAEEIAWHARHLYWRVDRTAPVVKARLSRDGAGMQVLVYMPDQKELFARLCGFFGSAGLSIYDAKIHTTRAGWALDTFTLNDPSRGTSYRETLSMVETELARVLVEQAPLLPPAEGRISRRVKHFPLTPEVQIFPDDKGTHYILEVVAGDRPGLLARIAYTLAHANINVASAKINTLGDRAEDVFLIEGPRLHDEQALLRLETAIYEQLKT